MSANTLDRGVLRIGVFVHQGTNDGLELTVDLQSDGSAAGIEMGGFESSADFVQEPKGYRLPQSSVRETYVSESAGGDVMENEVVVCVAFALSRGGRYLFEQNSSNGCEVAHTSSELRKNHSLSSDHAVDDLRNRGRRRNSAKLWVSLLAQGDRGVGRG